MDKLDLKKILKDFIIIYPYLSPRIILRDHDYKFNEII